MKEQHNIKERKLGLKEENNCFYYSPKTGFQCELTKTDVIEHKMSLADG